MDRREFLAVSSVGIAATAGCIGAGRGDGGAEERTEGDARTKSAVDERANRGEITVSASGDAEAEPDRQSSPSAFRRAARAPTP